VIIGVLNLLLFFIGMVFLVPKKIWKTSWSDYKQVFSYHYVYLFIIFVVVAVHLLEVKIIDQNVTNFIGQNFTNNFQTIEDGIVYWFSQNWTPVLLYFFVFIYIILYPFMLWFSLLYFLIVDERIAMKTFAYSLVFIYAIALPFYLFLPVTNVYIFYGSDSALNAIIPGVEQFFYATTTNNNCFPSLHVAMSLLIAKTVSLTANKRFIYLAYFCAICVICSVIYLAIHWITDVIGGILLAFSVFYLIKRFIKET
jgi:membrane-associated phospholipid phosphatase